LSFQPPGFTWSHLHNGVKLAAQVYFRPEMLMGEGDILTLTRTRIAGEYTHVCVLSSARVCLFDFGDLNTGQKDLKTNFNQQCLVPSHFCLLKLGICRRGVVAAALQVLRT
jgi:hypothetical protein